MSFSITFAAIDRVYINKSNFSMHALNRGQSIFQFYLFINNPVHNLFFDFFHGRILKTFLLKICAHFASLIFGFPLKLCFKFLNIKRDQEYLFNIDADPKLNMRNQNNSYDMYHTIQSMFFNTPWSKELVIAHKTW